MTTTQTNLTPKQLTEKEQNIAAARAMLDWIEQHDVPLAWVSAGLGFEGSTVDTLETLASGPDVKISYNETYKDLAARCYWDDKRNVYLYGQIKAALVMTQPEPTWTHPVLRPTEPTP